MEAEGLVLNPGFAPYKLCDLGQLFNLSVALVSHQKIEHNNWTYITVVVGIK